MAKYKVRVDGTEYEVHRSELTAHEVVNALLRSSDLGNNPTSADPDPNKYKIRIFWQNVAVLEVTKLHD